MIALVMAAALVGVDRPIVTGADYLEACGGRDPRQSAACRAYFSGALATAQIFHARSAAEADAPANFICPDHPDVDMQDASVSMILAEPGYLTRPAALGILAGLLDTYPCDPVPAPSEADTEPDEAL